MYDQCYFCLVQLPKFKKESTASFFVNFRRSRVTKEPAKLTVFENELTEITYICIMVRGVDPLVDEPLSNW